jgi:hypothetical protein
MPYMNCPACGLTVKMRGAQAMMEHCPRCLARGRRLGGLFVSEVPTGRKPIPREGRGSESERLSVGKTP